MVRQGALAFVILSLAACTQDVDDPANFTSGNSQGNASEGTEATGTTEAASGSGVAEGGGTGTTGSVDTTAADTTAAGEGPVGNCGNGVIDMGEQCDGADLQGFTCDSLGLNGGTLACDGMMCTFDTQMCNSTTGGTSG